MVHLDICLSPVERKVGRQRQFYLKLFSRLAEL